MQNLERLLKKPAVAEQLNVSVRTVDNLIKARAIEVVRVGGAVRFSPTAIEKFKKARTVATA